MAVSGLFAMNAAEVTVHFPDACADLLGGNSNVVLTTFEAEGFTFSFEKNRRSNRSCLIINILITPQVRMKALSVCILRIQ